MAEPGAVAWQFERKGLVVVPGTVDEDELMMAALDAGADDISRDGDVWNITSDPTETMNVREAIEAAGIAVESADLTMLPTSVVSIDSVESAKAVLRVIDALDDHDDVQEVYANFDIPDDVLQSID
jgi:transcriptional/translational regulatory protein YebC/TACO1